MPPTWRSDLRFQGPDPTGCAWAPRFFLRHDRVVGLLDSENIVPGVGGGTDRLGCFIVITGLRAVGPQRGDIGRSIVK